MNVQAGQAISSLFALSAEAEGREREREIV
jgi:hypothetical protein